MDIVIRVGVSKLDPGKRAGKRVQQVKCLLHNRFNPQDQAKDGGREPTPQNCPLSSTYIPKPYVQFTITYTHTH